MSQTRRTRGATAAHVSARPKRPPPVNRSLCRPHDIQSHHRFVSQKHGRVHRKLTSPPPTPVQRRRACTRSPRVYGFLTFFFVRIPFRKVQPSAQQKRPQTLVVPFHADSIQKPDVGSAPAKPNQIHISTTYCAGCKHIDAQRNEKHLDAPETTGGKRLSLESIMAFFFFRFGLHERKRGWGWGGGAGEGEASSLPGRYHGDRKGHREGGAGSLGYFLSGSPRIRR